MTLSVEKPNPLQQVAEMIGEFTGSLGDQIIGHGYEKYQSFLTCIFLFVLLNNLLGLIPGVPPPTVSPWVPLGLAAADVYLLQLPGLPRAGVYRLPEALLRAAVVDGVAAVADRTGFALRSHHVADDSSLREHVCQRYGDARVSSR